MSRDGWYGRPPAQIFTCTYKACTNFFQDKCSEHLHVKSSESGWVVWSPSCTNFFQDVCSEQVWSPSCTNFFQDVCSEHLHVKSSESGWVDLPKFQVVWSRCSVNFFPDVCSEHLHLQSSESGWVDLQNSGRMCSEHFGEGQNPF